MFLRGGNESRSGRSVRLVSGSKKLVFSLVAVVGRIYSPGRRLPGELAVLMEGFSGNVLMLVGGSS